MKPPDMKIDTPRAGGRFLKTPHALNIASIVWDMDRLASEGRLSFIKKGSSTTVAVLYGKPFELPFDMLVKRINSRGGLHSLIKRLSGSRAARLYGVTCKLFAKGLNVPEPLGFLDARDGKSSFYISKYIDALSLAVMYKDGAFKDMSGIARELSRALSYWHLSGAVHGDLKWSNILVTKVTPFYKGGLGGIKAGKGFGCFFVDLDQTRLFARPSAKGAGKDLGRFFRTALQVGAEKWFDDEFLPAYLEALPAAFRSGIDVEVIRRNARREHFLKTGK
ncbi:MAG: hypothetical protein WA162_01755 [Thermodesulfobacteriota bacterium]